MYQCTRKASSGYPAYAGLRAPGDDAHADGIATRRRVHGIDPERGERRVHRALEHGHQVRLPLISTRGRVQIGSGFDCTCSVRGPPLVCASFALHTKNIEYSGGGSSWATMARPIAMISATMPSIRSLLLSLAGLRLPAGSWATATQ
jgi:hypothetical protein